MRCQHGKIVKVVVQPVSSVCWDDGIVSVNIRGERQSFDEWLADQKDKDQDNTWVRYYNAMSYLPIVGCPKCKTIKLGGN